MSPDREADLGGVRAAAEAADLPAGGAADVVVQRQRVELRADHRVGERLVEIADVALAVDVGLGAERHRRAGGAGGVDDACRRRGDGRLAGGGAGLAAVTAAGAALGEVLRPAPRSAPAPADRRGRSSGRPGRTGSSPRSAARGRGRRSTSRRSAKACPPWRRHGPGRSPRESADSTRSSDRRRDEDPGADGLTPERRRIRRNKGHEHETGTPHSHEDLLHPLEDTAIVELLWLKIE